MRSRLLSTTLGSFCFVVVTTAAAAAAQTKTDTLVVNVSEDAYLGNALYTVAMDGKQIGGTHTASALHKNARSQNLTLKGAWGTAAHTVTVSFLNDAYGGTADTDRNLYVNSVTYDGVATAVNTEMYSAGSLQVAIAAAAPTVAPKATVFAPGVNLSGLEFNGGTLPGRVNYDYPAPSSSELDYYASKGIMVIRLPMLWERLQPGLQASPSSTAFDPNYLALITNILSYASTKGMSVIVDVHDYGAYMGNKIGQSGGVSLAQFAAFWQQFAGVLKAYPAVMGYDLMNEPNGFSSAATWPAAAQAATTAIRQVDTKTPIFVEGDGWASAGAWTSVNNSLNITDPSSSIVYEAHVYGDSDNSGTHFAWATEAAAGVTVNTIAQRAAVFGGWCQSNGHVCMIGEVGVGNDSPNWNTELNNGLAQMKANGLITATYWAGGPWWGSYPMSIEPNNGVDAPQMAVLDSYAQ